ncbi:MAG: 16S rRNA (cytidine(1402)-2'-O)-methyltransferase [Vulcanimicrobiaceae bacterium]
MPLVFVPTPLGNLRDITLRALDVLQTCDILVAEDSRVARKLLGALNLGGKEIWTYHEHNARRSTDGILARAKDGVVAVVTDAGMPGISDPGVELVASAREDGITVEVLPGPSALTGAAVLSGFDLRRFVFEGFLPRTPHARMQSLQRCFDHGITAIWYESPQRIVRTLQDIAGLDPQREVFLLREYTKLHEQQLCGSATEVLQGLAQPVRGEIVLVISGKAPVARTPDNAEIDATIETMLEANRSVSAIAKTLAEQGFGQRRHLYARVSERKRLRAVLTPGASACP